MMPLTIHCVNPVDILLDPAHTLPMSQTDWPLRAARVARGWSQSRAADELASVASARGVAVAAPLSLKTQLSRWENQHAQPDEHYRVLLCELYESTESELGLSEPSGPPGTVAVSADALRAQLAAAAATAADETAIELIRGQLRNTRALDDRLGTVAVAGSAYAQLSHLEGALWHATRPAHRRRLGRLVVDAATLAGRLALDGARATEAWRHYETAKVGAREADSPTLLGYAMVEQAVVLADIGERATALELVEQGVTMVAADMPGPQRAWFEAARGEALAAAGVAGHAHEAYRHAEQKLNDPVGRDASFAEIPFLEFDHAALHRYRGHGRRLLREDRSAIEDLQRALHDGGGSLREIAGVHVDLVHAHAAIGQRTDAARHARSAREIATRIGSARLNAQLDAQHPAADLEPASPS
jgi:transcriptional regulator with XRE-family HTH domain